VGVEFLNYRRLREHGMQTFGQSLFYLYQQNIISYQDALRFADSANNLQLHIKLEPDGRKPAHDEDKADLHIV
jgi:twitching motility protein PilU